MKKNDVLIAASAIAFSCLFYHQLPGINYLLFTVMVSAVILLTNPGKISDKSWWYYCACANVTGLAVFLINSHLSVFACVISLLVLGGKTFSGKNSLLVCGFFSLWSIVSSMFYRVGEMVTAPRGANGAENGSRGRMIISVVIAFVIACLFFYLYRRSNPLFNKAADSIDLSWLNFGWIWLTFLGLLILYGLSQGKRIEM